MTALLTRPLTVDKPVVKETPPAPVRPAEKPPGFVSLDAYRGFIMLFMASSGLYLWQVAPKIPTDHWSYTLWKFFEHHSGHGDWVTEHYRAVNGVNVWVGPSLYDLIQPAFMFMVGVAIPYSYASRKAKGQSEPVIWFHTIWR